MTESKRDTGPVAGIGDRVLARITALGADADYPYQARTIKRLARAGRAAMLGIFRALPGGAGVLDPIDRKQLKEWPVPRGSDQRCRERRAGSLRADALVAHGRADRPRASSGSAIPQAQQMTSLIAIHAHGIPDSFPDACWPRPSRQGA